MYNRRVLEQKLDYIHNNPVKAGLCQLPEEYQYSSAAYYILNTETPMHALYGTYLASRLWCGENTDHSLVDNEWKISYLQGFDYKESIK